MKFIKLTTIILIISAGLIGSFWIIKDAKKTTSETAGFSLENAVKPGGTLFKYVEKAAQDITNDASKNSFNLTESLSKSVFEQIKSTDFPNQNNENLSADINLMSGNLANNILEKQLLDFNLIFDINNSDLKISQDNSQEAKIKYLETIGKINKNNLGDFNKNYLEVIIDVFQKLDISSAVQLTNIYKNLANDYLNITVPNDWVDIHKELIIHFKNSEIVYRTLSNYLNDPVGGYLALEIIEEIAVDNSELVQNFLNEKIKEIGL